MTIRKLPSNFLLYGEVFSSLVPLRREGAKARFTDKILQPGIINEKLKEILIPSLAFLLLQLLSSSLEYGSFCCYQIQR